MLPKKCLTSCDVPYLCMIACPLNNRLEEIEPGAVPALAADEQLLVEIDETDKNPGAIDAAQLDDKQPTT